MNTQCKNVTFNIKNIKYAGEVQTNRSFVWHWSYQIKIDIYNDKIFYVIPLVTKKKIQKLCSKYRKENEKRIIAHYYKISETQRKTSRMEKRDKMATRPIETVYKMAILSPYLTLITLNVNG